MGVRYNVFTGQLDVTGSGGSPPPSSGYYTQIFVLDALQVAAKSVTLSLAPTTPTSTLFMVRGGPSQGYSLDFTVSGNTVSWNGLALDGILEIGDQITIVHD